jgi:Uma2 family endonuclease
MQPPSDTSDVSLPLVAPQSCFPMRVQPAKPLTDEALYRLCLANRGLRIERTAQGELIVMSPTGGETGRRNAAITAALYAWASRDGTGMTFDSSTGWILPNGAERAPDASWVLRQRWDALTPAQRERFPPMCPDFVLELRSPSDSLDEAQAKMNEYMANGARLGWLVDPESRRVWVYEQGRVAVCQDQPERVTGDPVLPGFVLELGPVWSAS